VEGISTIATTPHSIDNIASTVPIWSILGITEEYKYKEKYHAKKEETWEA